MVNRLRISLSRKIAIAKQLEKWGISAIETEFFYSQSDSFTACSGDCQVLTRTAIDQFGPFCQIRYWCLLWSFEACWYPQIHVFIAASPDSPGVKLQQDKGRNQQTIKEHVSYARSKFEIVEFSPERLGQNWISSYLVQTAVDAGASYINIPDTVGFTAPAEYGAIFKYLIDHVKTDREIIYSHPHCHDDLGRPWRIAS